MNVQLSISMLVSDRSVTLRKCLDSLKDIVRELSCELIVVFTGEKEETLDIVKQYTDHIIPFQWCNDFSAARNAGLREARGEWFLYIDDDEWFEDTSELIAFFQTGECSDYQLASYKIRNYLDWEGKHYTEDKLWRIYRNEGDLEFIGSIHECISKTRGIGKSLNSYVHHYGYVSEKKGKGSRSDRNIPLLLDEIEKNPLDTKNYMQLAQEYRNTEEFDKAEECCRKGIALSKKAPIRYTSDLWLMAYLPIFLAFQKKYKEALAEVEGLLKTGRLPDVPKAYLYYTAVIVCVDLQDFEKGIAYARRFHKIREKLHGDGVELQNQEHGEMSLAGVDQKTNDIYSCGLHMAVKAKDFQAVSEILSWIPWEDESSMKRYYAQLEQWKNRFQSEKEEILQCLAEIPVNSCYLLLQKALYAEQQNRISDLQELLRKCQEAYGAEDAHLSSQIVAMALRYEADVAILLKKIPLEYWSGYADQAAKDTGNQNLESELMRIRQILKDAPLHCSLFEQSFMERQMMLGWFDGRELLELTESYCESVMGYYRTFLKESCFEEGNAELLPTKCAFAFLVQQAMEAAKHNRQDCYVENLRKALYVCPEFSEIIGKLLKAFAKNEMQTSNPEFTQLGKQVKAQIRMLISQGQYEEAYQILMRLMQMLPNDLELLRLKQQIITQKQPENQPEASEIGQRIQTGER